VNPFRVQQRYKEASSGKSIDDYTKRLNDPDPATRLDAVVDEEVFVASIDHDAFHSPRGGDFAGDKLRCRACGTGARREGASGHEQRQGAGEDRPA
jgi:hypothetical protein